MWISDVRRASGVFLMEPSLDYRIDILLTLFRFQIRELRNFYDEGEEQFDFGFDKLKVKIDQLTDMEWELREDFYIGQRDALESLRELKRHFAVVGLFTVFETFLRDILDYLGCAKEPDPKSGYKERWRFEDMKIMFASIGIRITKPDRDWNAVKKLQAIRHCIIHLGSRPDLATVRKLKDYNFEVREDVWMELPQGYFEESADLVQHVGERIVRDCKAEFPLRRVDS